MMAAPIITAAAISPECPLMFVHVSTGEAAHQSVEQTAAAGKEREREEKKKNLRSLFGFFFFFSMNWVRCIRHSPLNGGGGGRSDSLACLQLGPRIQRSGIATSRMTLQTSA